MNLNASLILVYLIMFCLQVNNFMFLIRKTQSQDWVACGESMGKTTEGMRSQTDSLVFSLLTLLLAIFPLSLCVHSKHTSVPALVINTSNHIPVLPLLWWLDHSMGIIFHPSLFISTLCFSLPYSAAIDLTASPFPPINTYFDICVAVIV